MKGIPFSLRPGPAFILIAVICTALLVVAICNIRGSHPARETRAMMNTYVTICASGPKASAAGAISQALDRMQEIDAKFSYFNPKGQVYAFNHTGTPIADPEILRLARIALDASQETGGAFDITVAPLLELWGFYERSFRVPQEQAIKDCLGKVGYQHLIIDDGVLKKDAEGVRIDFGGVAKGYALNEAMRVLKARGITSALIDAGGDVYVLGKKGGKPWKVGVRDPRGGLLGYIEAEDTAVVGSGDYERYFLKDGKRYGHIFDPRTGYPTQGVASVTLMYSDPTRAQIWAKMPFVMGPGESLEILQKIPGMEAIIITSSGEKIYSSGLKHLIEKEACNGFSRSIRHIGNRVICPFSGEEG